MAITKRVMQFTAMAAGVIGVAATTAPDSAVGRYGRLSKRLSRDARFAVASAPGILHGDTRPSQGAALPPPSGALRKLLDARRGR